MEKASSRSFSNVDLYLIVRTFLFEVYLNGNIRSIIASSSTYVPHRLEPFDPYTKIVIANVQEGVPSQKLHPGDSPLGAAFFRCAAVNRGTEFRYCSESPCTSEYNGTGFR